jgi:hypothetical protein
MIFPRIDTPLILDNAEIIKILSGGRNSEGLSDKMLIRLEELKNHAKDMIEPKAVYNTFEISDLPQLPYFSEAEKVVLGVCTIGKDLPDTVTQLMVGGKLVDGTILDAIGSVAADTVADKVNEIIDRETKTNGIETTMRYSPGYCSWALTGQSVIFNRLDTEKIGVTLTEAFLMLPVKSVSFAINIGKEVKSSAWETRCQRCQKVCEYRRN